MTPKPRHRRPLLPRGPILLVDDEPAIRQLCRTVLEKAGHQVLVAGDATSALEVARETPPSAALLDVVLPGIGGPELAQRLREIYPDLPLAFLSGYGVGAATALQKGHLGAMWIAKPFTCDQLVAQVALLLKTPIRT